MLLQYGNATVESEWKVDEKVPPGYSRVYYIFDGEVKYEDSERTTGLRKGYLYIFPSASGYSMKQNPLNPLNCAFMHIELFPSLITALIEVPVEEHPVLKCILMAFAAGIDAGDLKVIEALSDVFVIYCREHGLITSSEDKIASVLTYIAEHIEEPMPIGELSHMAGYNEQYFIRFFKRHVGLPPHRYIINHRLREAKKFLKAGISIGEAARMTGYGDVKLFSRSFRKTFGLSPTRFRITYTPEP
ncbi:MAG: helix-turn-helix domain-containing protein [Saccharofermentanales bacterium]